MLSLDTLNSKYAEVYSKSELFQIQSIVFDGKADFFFLSWQEYKLTFIAEYSWPFTYLSLCENLDSSCLYMKNFQMLSLNK